MKYDKYRVWPVENSLVVFAEICSKQPLNTSAPRLSFRALYTSLQLAAPAEIKDGHPRAASAATAFHVTWSWRIHNLFGRVVSPVVRVRP